MILLSFFQGTKIQVYGLLDRESSQVTLSANYAIDMEEPVSDRFSVLDKADNMMMSPQILYESPYLQEGIHNITINSIMGTSRHAYTLSEFSVLITNQTTADQSSTSQPHGNVAQHYLIIGVIVGVVAVLSLSALGGILYHKRRRSPRNRLLLSSTTNVTALRPENGKFSLIISPLAISNTLIEPSSFVMKTRHSGLLSIRIVSPVFPIPMKGPNSSVISLDATSNTESEHNSPSEKGESGGLISDPHNVRILQEKSSRRLTVGSG